MSENAVTIDPSRVTVSDRTLKRNHQSTRTTRQTPVESAGTSNTPTLKPEVLQVDASSKISTPSVTFVVDQDSGESFIQVIDRDSGKILRQIPPEEVRRLAEALEEMIGNVVDTVA